VSLFRRKTVQKGELRDIGIELVSLLFDDMKPANGKSAIFKDSDGKGYVERFSSTKFKSDDQGRVYVTVMEPGVKDSQGDHQTEAEVVKAMDRLAKKGLVRKNDVNHNMLPVNDVYIAEHYILKNEDKVNFPDTKLGSGVEVLKFDTTGENWQKVKAGKFNGVSYFGYADDYGDNTFTKAIGELRDVLKSLQKSDDSGSKEAAKVLEVKISELEKKADKGTNDAQFKELVKSVNDLVGSLNKVVSKSINSEPGGGTMAAEEKVIIKGEEILLKSYHKEIAKAWATDGDPKKIQILTENTAEQFIDEVLETKEDEVLSEISVLHLDKDNKVDAGEIADLVLKNELDGSPTAQEITDSEITVSPQILLGEYKLKKTTTEEYEEKFGIEKYLAWALNKLRNKVFKAIKKLLWKGDRDSGTASLKGMNGVIALATDASDLTEIGKVTYSTWEDRFEAALLSFSEDVLEHMENFKIYVSMKDMIRVRKEAKKAGNVIQGRLLIEGKKVYFDEIQIKGRFMTDDYIIAGITKFIIFGVRADADVYRQFIPWYYHWYVRLRAGITYVTGFVKVFNLADGS